MGADTVKQKKVGETAREFGEWLTSVFNKALTTREGFKPETIRQFETAKTAGVTPHRKLNEVKVAKIETTLDPQLKKLLEQNKNAVVEAEKLSTLLTAGAEGKRFRFDRDWVG